MIEDNKYIDKVFKEKLGERTFEVPAAFIADLEKRLDVPKVGTKKIKGFWFWLSSLALVAISSAALAYFYPKTNTNNPIELVSVAKTPLIASNGHSNSISSPIFIKVKKADNKEAFVPVAKFKKNKDSFNPKTDEDFSGVKKRVQANYKAVEDSIAQANLNDLAYAKNNSSTAFVAVNEESAVHKLLSQDADFGKGNGQMKSIQYGDKTINFIDDSLTKIRYIIRDSLVIRDSVVIRDSFPDNKKEDREDLKDEKDKKKTNFEIQGFGGFMFVQPKVSSPSSPYQSSIVAQETRIISPNFGFNLNYNYNKMSVGSGLSYYQFGEKTNYTTSLTTATVDSISQSTSTVYLDSAGNIITPTPNNPAFDSITIVTIDTSFNYNTTFNTKSWLNSYSRVVVPISFGYCFEFKNWSLIPRVGLNLEFTTLRQKGLYPDAKQEEILELDQRKFGLSYQLQLELRRNLGPWHVFVNPYYRNNIGYVINTTDLQRKYGGFGTTFGVGVRF